MNASLSVHKTVVATGGSVVYGERAMRHLRGIGTVVYLKVAESALEGRLQNIFRRGVVMRKKGETVAELYAERAPLYEKYAHITVTAPGRPSSRRCVRSARRCAPERKEKKDMKLYNTLTRQTEEFVPRGGQGVHVYLRAYRL